MARQVTGREILERNGTVHMVSDAAPLQTDNGTSDGVAARIRRDSPVDSLARFSRQSHKTLVAHGTAAIEPGFGNAKHGLIEFDVTVPTAQDFFRSDDG